MIMLPVGYQISIFHYRLRIWVFKTTQTTTSNEENSLGSWCFLCIGQSQPFPFNNWNAISKIQLWLIWTLLWRSVSQGLGKETALHQLAEVWWMHNLQLLSGHFLVFSSSRYFKIFLQKVGRNTHRFLSTLKSSFLIFQIWAGVCIFFPVVTITL